jgi:hypothetical protein
MSATLFLVFELELRALGASSRDEPLPKSVLKYEILFPGWGKEERDAEDVGTSNLMFPLYQGES